MKVAVAKTDPKHSDPGKGVGNAGGGNAVGRGLPSGSANKQTKLAKVGTKLKFLPPPGSAAAHTATTGKKAATRTDSAPPPHSKKGMLSNISFLVYILILVILQELIWEQQNLRLTKARNEASCQTRLLLLLLLQRRRKRPGLQWTLTAMVRQWLIYISPT